MHRQSCLAKVVDWIVAGGAAGVIASACAAEGSGGSGGTGTGSSGGNSGSNSGSSSGTGNSGSASGFGQTGSSSGGFTGSSSSGSQTGQTGSATGTTGSITGSTTGSATGAVTGSTTGTTNGAFKTCPPGGTSCAATVGAGALPLSTNYLGGGDGGAGFAGYAFVVCDPSGSSACLPSTAFCTAGSALPGPGSATTYGAGAGVNLNQALGAMVASPYTVPASSTGISYTLTGTIPSQGVQLIVDSGGKQFCSLISATALSGTALWSTFNTYCSGPPLLGGAPTGPTQIIFQVPVATGAAATPFNFCVTHLSF